MNQRGLRQACTDDNRTIAGVTRQTLGRQLFDVSEYEPRTPKLIPYVIRLIQYWKMGIPPLCEELGPSSIRTSR